MRGEKMIDISVNKAVKSFGFKNVLDEFDNGNDGKTFVIINCGVERFAVNGQCSDFGCR